MNDFKINQNVIDAITEDLVIPSVVEDRIEQTLHRIASHPHARRAQQRVRHPRRIVALVAACVLIVPGFALAAYASGENSPFYQAIFGNVTRSSISEKMELDSDGKVSLNLPNTERVAVDEAVADELIGANVQTDTGVYEWTGYNGVTTRMSVENVLYDSVTGTFQLYMVLEREGGFPSFTVTENGECYFSNSDVQFAGNFCPGRMYYDRAASSENKICMTAVGVASNINEPKIMEILELVPTDLVRTEDLPADFGALQDGSMPSLVTFQRSEVDFTQLARSLSAIHAGEGITLNPIGMQLDLAALGFRDAVDDYALNDVAITFQDGTEYTLRNRDANVENTDYILTSGAEHGTAQGTRTTFCLNRLVDIRTVAGVRINGQDYPVS